MFWGILEYFTDAIIHHHISWETRMLWKGHCLKNQKTCLVVSILSQYGSWKITSKSVSLNLYFIILREKICLHQRVIFSFMRAKTLPVLIILCPPNMVPCLVHNRHQLSFVENWRHLRTVNHWTNGHLKIFLPLNHVECRYNFFADIFIELCS